MSKKTYMAVAALLRYEMSVAVRTEQERDKNVRLGQLQVIASGLADIFKADNPSFNYGKFFAACEFDKL